MTTYTSAVNQQCPYCVCPPHQYVGQCPAIRAIEYYADGTIKRVEKVSTEAVSVCRALIARTEALRELVEVRELRQALDREYRRDEDAKEMTDDEFTALEYEYSSREPAGWETARAALSEQEGKG